MGYRRKIANNENGKGSKRIKKRRKEIRRKNKKIFPKDNPNRKKKSTFTRLCAAMARVFLLTRSHKKLSKNQSIRWFVAARRQLTVYTVIFFLFRVESYRLNIGPKLLNWQCCLL